MCKKLSYLFIVVICITSEVLSQSFRFGSIQHAFVNQLINQLGNGSTITREDVQLYYTNSQWKVLTDDITISTCTVNSSGYDESCLFSSCLSPRDVHRLSGLQASTDEEKVSTLSTILLYLSESGECSEETSGDTESGLHTLPSTLQVWGYSILCTTIIAVSALGGLLALPCVEGLNYKRILIYMVGLAVGTLAGSSLLFLIPEALELTDAELDSNSYVWKCLVMVSAVIVFFNIERILKYYSLMRERVKREKNASSHFSTIYGGRFAFFTPESGKCLENPRRLRDVNSSKPRDLEGMHSMPGMPNIDKKAVHATALRPVMEEVNETNGAVNEYTTVGHSEESAGTHVAHVHESAETHVAPVQESDEPHVAPVQDSGETHVAPVQDSGETHVAPVAWMILFGDALHNLVDGMSIGAAFSNSVLAGVSVSVAILCEELPHELGDFAILVSSGMSIKRAAVYNFLSACSIYIGVVLGIFLGENPHTHTWIFAFAAGMFLYIALVNMMSEMSAASDLKENKEELGTGPIFLLQNLGMLSGFGIMLTLAVLGGKIETAIRGGN